MPIFSGKTEYEPFVVQFQMLAFKFNWNSVEQCENLKLCLRDEALTYVSQLPVGVRYSINALMKQ